MATGRPAPDEGAAGDQATRVDPTKPTLVAPSEDTSGPSSSHEVTLDPYGPTISDRPSGPPVAGDASSDPRYQADTISVAPPSQHGHHHEDHHKDERPSTDSTAPPDLGGLTIKGRLGVGGMGEVYRVHDPVIGREVALKAIRPGSDALSHQRFVQEARLTGQLEHPNIVPVHALEPDGERPFFTMKHVAGKDLGALLQSMQHHLVPGHRAGRPRRLPQLPELLRVFDKICDAVAFAHSKGVIHRDLKPANIMVGEFGEVQVMDWGLAKLQTRAARDLPTVPVDPPTRSADADAPASPVDAAPVDDRPIDGTTTAQLTIAGGILGTPGYMAPEQARGETDRVDERADVYALGAILYELLTLSPAFVGDTVEDVLGQVRAGALVRPSERCAHEVPWELEVAVLRAMAPEMEDRYARVADLQADVASFLEGNLLEAADYSPLQRAVKWIVRNKVVSAFVVFTVATAIIVGLQLQRARTAEAAARASERDKGRALASALQSAVTANERLAQFEQLADLNRARTLQAQARDELWPIAPGLAAPARRWLEALAQLDQRMTHHRALITQLASQPVRERSDVDSVLLSALSEVVRIHNDLQSNRGLPHPCAATAAGIRRRAELASQLDVWRVADAEAWAALDQRGWTHGVIPGLYPLGRDPDSGLEELAHRPSGEVPTRDGAGRLAIGPDSCVVFVALPGGAVRIGADNVSDGGAAREDEAPVRRRIAPLLVAKHELTRQQWYRLAGGERPDAAARRLPVTDVSWADATQLCARWAMALPSEAQWEYGARAGTTSPWWTGADALSLRAAANLADLSYAAADPNRKAKVAWDDGAAGPATVGARQPNAFGLHDVHGNVAEWTSSTYTARHAATPAAGEVTQPVHRGGGWASGALDARAARRVAATPETREADIGLRPVIHLPSANR